MASVIGVCWRALWAVAVAVAAAIGPLCNFGWSARVICCCCSASASLRLLLAASPPRLLCRPACLSALLTTRHERRTLPHKLKRQQTSRSDKPISSPQLVRLTLSPAHRIFAISQLPSLSTLSRALATSMHPLTRISLLLRCSRSVSASTPQSPFQYSGKWRGFQVAALVGGGAYLLYYFSMGRQERMHKTALGRGAQRMHGATDAAAPGPVTAASTRDWQSAGAVKEGVDASYKAPPGTAKGTLELSSNIPGSGKSIQGSGWRSGEPTEATIESRKQRREELLSTREK